MAQINRTTETSTSRQTGKPEAAAASGTPDRTPATAQMVDRIRTMVSRSAARWKRLIILEALAIVIAAPLTYLWLVFIIDNLFHLPVWGRVLASLGFFAAVVWLVVSLVRRWRQLHFTEDQVALAMERQSGGIQNRLINAIQISRDSHGENQFDEAVVQENYENLQKIELHQAAQIKPAMIRLAVAGLVILFGVGFWVVYRENFKNAATRIMLPFAAVDPLYDTVLSGFGDVEGGGDVTITINIKGQIPPSLSVLRSVDGQRTSERVVLPKTARSVFYTFKNVDRTTRYAVSGGDFTSPYFNINVPTPSSLSLVKATFHYPEYTRLPPKSVESAGGDMEALLGTKAQVTFVFDRAPDEAVMLLNIALPANQPTATAAPKAGAGKTASGAGGPPKPDPSQRIVMLKKVSPTEYSTEITFVDVLGYQLKTQQGDRAPHLTSRYALRVRADADPTLDLTGLKKQAEVNVDAILPVKAIASDDFGLNKVGLFARKVLISSAAAETVLNSPGIAPESSPGTAAPGSAAAASANDGGWSPVTVWDANNVPEFRKDHELSVAALGAVEGEKYEVTVRGSDFDPLKKGTMIDGPTFTLLVGGEGVSLQLTYEQILQTEADFKVLIAAEQNAMTAAKAWMAKLEPASGLRWDDKATLDSLAAAMKAQAAEQEKIRLASGRVARDMVPQAGSLRLALGMLADTEMPRVIRILEAVPGRDNPQDKRSALADAKMAQERTVRSLQDMLDDYTRFRQDWELSNMVPFTKMLADRQAGMRDESTRNVTGPAPADPAPRQASAQRRQAKVVALVQLAQIAFTGLSARVKDEPIIAKGFTDAAAALASSELRNPMNEAAELVKAGRWAEAAQRQTVAAEKLAAVNQILRKAQLDAAAAALAALKEKAKSDALAQAEIERLKKNEIGNFLDGFDEKKLTLSDILHMKESAKRKAERGEDAKPDMYMLPEGFTLNTPDSGKRQDFNTLKLAEKPTGEPSFPNSSDRKATHATPHIDENFKDLTGPLLEEADLLKEKYETYNINVGVNINEPGEIGKQGGDLNSTAASAATGNQKPPTQNVGGASRAGLQGARAHGAVVGSEGNDRRGRDEAQEGQERAADQSGSIKMKKTGDEAKDTSTGWGGKKVEDQNNTWSLKDAGKWDDDLANRMGKVEATAKVVERADGKIDARVAEMLRDLESTQEQVIERVKAIKKELNNLYLPTDRLDEIEKELARNLDSLKERPTEDVFRLQAQTLDKLRSLVRVLGDASSGYEPSVPRDQQVRGRVLDEPARQTIPGYEEAVKQYYEALSTQ